MLNERMCPSCGASSKMPGTMTERRLNGSTYCGVCHVGNPMSKWLVPDQKDKRPSQVVALLASNEIQEALGLLQEKLDEGAQGIWLGVLREDGRMEVWGFGDTTYANTNLIGDLFKRRSMDEFLDDED